MIRNNITALKVVRQPLKFKNLSRCISTSQISLKNKGYKNYQYGKNYKTTTIVASSALSTTLLAYLYTNNNINNISNDVSIEQLSKKSLKIITPQEVIKHNSKDDCWVVINDIVYDLTFFIKKHPGGQDVIVGNAGKDVSNIFLPLHPLDTIEKFIPKDKIIGVINEPMPADYICPKYAPGETPEEIAEKERLKTLLPSIGAISNLYDFEYLASHILSKQAWAYYSSAADDEVSLRENHSAYHRIFFKPKVLVDVSEIDLSTEFFGQKSDAPFYATAAALGKLGNPAEGEKDITRGVGQGSTKVPQMVSTLASCSIDEVMGARVSENQPIWFQLYVNSDRKITNDLVKHVEELGVKALFVTVDAPALGHREKDEKVKFSANQKESTNMLKEAKVDADADGASRALSKFIDPSLSWKDIIELKKLTKLPIIIKGVQRSEDVIKAAEIGCQGVVISNHGGRQLDFSRAPIEVLAESKPELEKRNLDKNFDIFIDGGVRRGTDILKALCLGAKGVGLGRPFIYANSCYGAAGVQRAVDILREELEMSMRLLGVTSVKDLNEDLLDLSALKYRSVSVPHDELSQSVYKHLAFTEFRPDDAQ
ncbi:hypothetical protein Kpol_1014p5 [Vanderwaltozyma polyspora DSM 70294]|uniref:L-lactate dehydrogenase (cytochrome) n=1 Tax=Vanderwaltozyma polyspora (strain ATCC 22028 / DSM 70294 / BCRC 21397 / CBS 2163 / NBRC 10782 / NRRL Y-8283 / UCD 57-17) TaxID=436907 RepID=A7TND5_VANPO|nr:uncharacterized protein Kpol_1014p5 [Vanderwaltozyma polyspora DSM 70294]EDO16188.1 hypothetical protein Kpol_1014p5 [Vanderwaltozyma polyspora DSM 70294]